MLTKETTTTNGRPFQIYYGKGESSEVLLAINKRAAFGPLVSRLDLVEMLQELDRVELETNGVAEGAVDARS